MISIIIAMTHLMHRSTVLFPEHWKTVGTVCLAAPVPLAPNTVLGWMMDEVNEGMAE